MDAATAPATKNESKKAATYDGSANPVRAEYYGRISQDDMAPLWVVLKESSRRSRSRSSAPANWHFNDVKASSMESGRSSPPRKRCAGC